MSERTVDWGRLARGCARRGCGVPPLGAAAPPGGCGAAVSPAGLRPPTGRGRGRGGGEGGGEEEFPAVPFWSPGAAPQRTRGGGLVVPVPGGPSPTGGAHSSPAPLQPLGARPSGRPSLGPLLSSLSPRGAASLGGGGGGR